MTGEGRGEGAAPRLDTATFGQGWKLDATGNWSGFNQFDAQSSTFAALDQQRTSNVANEITAIAGTVGAQWATPVYDRNGNMTSVPQPADMTAVYQGIWDAGTGSSDFTTVRHSFKEIRMTASTVAPT